MGGVRVTLSSNGVDTLQRVKVKGQRLDAFVTIREEPPAPRILRVDRRPAHELVWELDDESARKPLRKAIGSFATEDPFSPRAP